MGHTSGSGRRPVDEGLPVGLPPGERRPARMRLVAARRLSGITVVLDGVHDPHNISAVLRSCDAFGVQHVHLIGDRSALAPNRAITLGCHKWLTLHYHSEPSACADILHEQGFELWAAVPERHAVPMDRINFGRKIAFLFGAERNGLSDALTVCADRRYVIPMAGFSQSLNVSVAAAITLHTAAAGRRRALGGDSDMTEDEIAALAQVWIEADEEHRHRRKE